MQVTTNIETAPVQSANGNKFFAGATALMAKIINALQPKKQPKFTNMTVVEAIQFIEWRTKYDQYRILNAVYIKAALQQHPELCKALNVVQPTYISKQWREAEKITGDRWSKYQLKTRELLLASMNHTKTIHIEVTDNSFERKLVKFFGNLKPETQELITGVRPANKTFAYKKMTVEDQKAYRILNSKLEKKFFYGLMKYQGTDPDMLSLSHNIKAHEGLIHDDFISRIPVAQQTEVVVTPVTEPQRVAEPSQLDDESTLEIAVTQMLDNAMALVETSKTKPEDIKKVTKDLNKMTIPKLKAFAKERGLKLSGRTTQISAIRAAILRQLKENASQQ